MNIDVLFSVAKVYNVKKIDVLKGQVFDVLTDAPAETRWFSDNDAVLSIVDNGQRANITALSSGKSTILFMDNGDGVTDKMVINVVDSLEPAAALNATGEAIPK